MTVFAISKDEQEWIFLQVTAENTSDEGEINVGVDNDVIRRETETSHTKR